MLSRRNILTGLGATLVAPKLSWANAGAPDFLSAARKADGSYVLAGLRASGEITFEFALPDRGHAAAVHPDLPLAVAFARRPGTFGLVVDCATGRSLAKLQAPEGRHFYGHGVFSADGEIFFATENDYEAGQGKVSVWSASDFTRLGEFSSGGVGPHDIALMPDGKILVVANGGIETHPDAGRAKLNIPSMQPNLSYLSLNGTPLETVELGRALHKNSIRHLALSRDGLVGFAMQWQGAKTEHPSLLGLHRMGEAPRFLSAPREDQRRLRGYAGSVAISEEDDAVAITSPRGGVTQVFGLANGQLEAQYHAPDVCGLGAAENGFLFTTGKGVIGLASAQQTTNLKNSGMSWDNHLVSLHNGVVL